MENGVTQDRQAENEITISIAMACYNGEPFIREQLESLRLQEKLPNELVVVDDGSNDQTLSILETFSETSPFPVTIIKNQTNIGYQKSFLLAASRCKANFVAFCDQDDVWLPSKLKVCSEHLRRSNSILYVHMGEVWYGGGRTGILAEKDLKIGTHTPFTMDPLKSVFGFSMVFMRCLLDIQRDLSLPPNIYLSTFSVPTRNNIIGHDGLVWLLASMFGDITVIPDTLVLYRQHGFNTVGVKKRGTIVSRMRSLLRYVDLEKLIEIEMEYIEYLKILAVKGDHRSKISIEKMISILDARIGFQIKRVNLDKNRVTFMSRFQAFVGLILAREYQDDYCHDQFCDGAIRQDLIFRVFRLKSKIDSLKSVGRSTLSYKTRKKISSIHSKHIGSRFGDKGAK
jgi:glycosyltransferase involved in cell wall biosynthesis